MKGIWFGVSNLYLQGEPMVTGAQNFSISLILWGEGSFCLTSCFIQVHDFFSISEEEKRKDLDLQPQEQETSPDYDRNLISVCDIKPH